MVRLIVSLLFAGILLIVSIQGESKMVDILLGYSLLSILWAYLVDIRKMKGIAMQVGFILFFPFVLASVLVDGWNE